MSTKIYRAYRLKRTADLWKLVHEFKKKGQTNVREVLRKLHLSMMGAVDTKSEEYKKLLAEYKGDDFAARSTMTNQKMRDEYRKQSTSGMRDVFDFDVSMTFREYHGRIYIIPYCDSMMRDVLNFLDRDRRLESYCYWNNTDEPEGMSRREWRRREKNWNAMIEHDREFDFLSLGICEWTSYYQVDPTIEIAKEHMKKKAMEKKSGTKVGKS